MLHSFFAKEEGQGLVEYALILVLIAIVVSVSCHCSAAGSAGCSARSTAA